MQLFVKRTRRRRAVMKIGGQKLRRKQRQLTNGPYLPVEKITLEKRKQRAQRQRITWTSSCQQPPISPVRESQKNVPQKQ